MIPSRFGNDIKPAVRRGFALVSLLGFACIALAAPARATTQFSDSFAYPVGALAGHGPPPGSPAGQTGWSAVNRNPQVTSPGLVFTGIASSGNKVTVTGITGNQGDIAAANLNHVGGGTSTVWLAFLIPGGERRGYAQRRRSLRRRQ